MFPQTAGAREISMYKIVHKDPGPDIRLEADAVLTPADFLNHRQESWVARLFAPARSASSRRGRPRNRRWSRPAGTARKAIDTARAGDWIVTNLSPQQEALRDREGHANTYVIAGRAVRRAFTSRREDATSSAPSTAPRALSKQSGCPAASTSWRPGESGRPSPTGYLLSTVTEVYGNNAETFRATYLELP